jgi:hypothetical protein
MKGIIDVRDEAVALYNDPSTPAPLIAAMAETVNYASPVDVIVGCYKALYGATGLSAEQTSVLRSCAQSISENSFHGLGPQAAAWLLANPEASGEP